ncbi:MAG: serine/threonine protein kinase [Deltaproteobacteria bacterium]|nr:serine/threonine protein kinase [Deltaproteobacteria bacterium]
MDLGPGTQVTANVRLVRPLGEGGMGRVWLAEHLALQAPVAVKFISTQVPKSELAALIERFQREATAAARINDPHVVDIKDYGVMSDGAPFIVMELLEGESLGARLSRVGRLGLPEAALVVSQTAKALRAAHALGVVHRDIKPENIFLLTAHDELFVKVLDFGIAKLAGTAPLGRRLTDTGAMLGTPHYMAPEQLLTPKDVDHRADLWALGVVAYEMLAGEPPFTGETATALCIAICAAQFAPPSSANPEVPPPLDKWFSHALHREREHRFQSAKEMAVAFGAAAVSGAAGASAAAPEPEPSTTPRAEHGDGWQRTQWIVRAGPTAAPVGPTTPCDALSFGMAFEAAPAKLGRIVEVAAGPAGCPPEVNPASDNCDSKE